MWAKKKAISNPQNEDGLLLLPRPRETSVFVFVWQRGRTDWSTTASSSSAPRAARASSGSSFQQPPSGGAGMSGCCEGAVSTDAAVMPTTVHSDSGKRERSSATSNFVLMAAIVADGDAGLTIHGASLRK